MHANLMLRRIPRSLLDDREQCELQVETMQLIPGVEVTAVAAGSSKEKAEGFAKEHGNLLGSWHFASLRLSF